MRMRRASAPPTAKKNIAPMPYMMPIFLWSTEKNQLFHPVAPSGRANTPIGRAGVFSSPDSSSSGVRAISAIAFLRPSLQGREERDQFLDVEVREVVVGHAL